MITVYVITRFLTLFGTFLRAFWEHIVCRICKIATEEVKAFRYSEFCGHVEHEMVYDVHKSFLICSVPFAANFLLSCCFLFGSTFNLFYIGNTNSFASYLFLWLGISCAANCTPSFEDMLAFKDCISAEKNVFLKILYAPFFAVFCVMSCLEKYSLTFLLSILFAVVFPYVFDVFIPQLV